MIDFHNQTAYNKSMLTGKNAVTVDQLSFIIDAEINPTEVFNTKPDELYNKLIDMGFDVQPLGRGKLAGKDFVQDGGGYNIHYGGDGYIQYHPEEASHHGGEYYKIANGRNGRSWYNIHGEKLVK